VSSHRSHRHEQVSSPENSKHGRRRVSAFAASSQWGPEFSEATFRCIANDRRTYVENHTLPRPRASDGAAVGLNSDQQKLTGKRHSAGRTKRDCAPATSDSPM
jgi:hypothetical protein